MQRRYFISPFAGLIPGIPNARTNPGRADTGILIQQSAIAGFQYHHGEALWDQLAIGQAPALAREPDQRYDRRAVRVGWRGRKISYLPRVENAAVAQMLDRGKGCGPASSNCGRAGARGGGLTSMCALISDKHFFYAIFYGVIEGLQASGISPILFLTPLFVLKQSKWTFRPHFLN
jgi:hypothetical protein